MAFVVALILTITSILCGFALVAFVHDYLIFFPGITRNMMSSLEWWHPFVFLLILVLCWFLAGLSKGMYLVNGSGTKLFGHIPTPDGYIATKWLCLMFLPVLPVDSYEIVAQQDMGMQTTYIMRQLDELHWSQIAQTALKGFLGLIAVILGSAILFNLILFFIL